MNDVMCVMQFVNKLTNPLLDDLKEATEMGDSEVCKESISRCCIMLNRLLSLEELALANPLLDGFCLPTVINESFL